MRNTVRCTRVKVFPVPGPAIIRRGPLVDVIASRWDSLAFPKSKSGTSSGEINGSSGFAAAGEMFSSAPRYDRRNLPGVSLRQNDITLRSELRKSFREYRRIDSDFGLFPMTLICCEKLPSESGMS